MENKKRNRRTQEAILLDNLKEMAGAEAKPVSNDSLREALGWKKEKYDRVKNQVVGSNLAVRGKGRSGTLAPAGVQKEEALKIFISYSHVDERIKTALVNHLKPLERQNLVSSWHDRKIKPGAKWAEEISQNLKSANIVVLVVSVDFINSEYCYDIELEEAMERHESGDCRVVPVLARDCLWHGTIFGNLQALPKDANPIAQWASQDEAMTDVARGVEKIAKELLNI